MIKVMSRFSFLPSMPLTLTPCPGPQFHIRYTSSSSYDEELALYKLLKLELDADGEEDAEFDDTILGPGDLPVN